MKRKTTVFASVTILVGIVIMLLSLVSCGFNFKKLDASKKVTSEHAVSEDFENIHVVADTADIKLVYTDTQAAKVICQNEREKMKHSVEVNNGTLEIRINDERKWYNYINPFSFGEPEITVYLPKSEYNALKIEADTSDVEIPADFKFTGIDISLSTGDTECCASATEFIKINASTGDAEIENVTVGALEIAVSTGDLDIENVNAESLSLRTTTGRIEGSNINVGGAFSLNVSTGEASLSDVRAKSFTSGGSTGDLNLTRFVTEGMMNIERSTGDVTLNECDAGEIAIVTDTGNVRATLLTEKIFITRTDTGKVRVPETTTGGKCKITTDTGDITVSVKQ